MQPAIEFQRKYNVPPLRRRIQRHPLGPQPQRYRYLKDCIEIFESHGWDWSYHAFREFHGWSVEHGEDRKDTSPAASQPTASNAPRTLSQRTRKPAEIAVWQPQAALVILCGSLEQSHRHLTQRGLMSKSIPPSLPNRRSAGVTAASANVVGATAAGAAATAKTTAPPKSKPLPKDILAALDVEVPPVEARPGTAWRWASSSRSWS